MLTVLSVKLAERAKANGVWRSAAYRWSHAGILAVPAAAATEAGR